MPELMLERVPRDFGHRAGQLHARRPAADDHERQQLTAMIQIGFALGQLESGQQSPPDVGGIFDGLQPRAQLLPLGVAEVVILSAVATISVS